MHTAHSPTSRPPALPTRAIVLLARAACGSVPLQELARVAGQLAAAADGDHVMFAVTDEGEPSLREVVGRLRERRYAEIVIVPFLFPMEPNLISALEHDLRRWQAESGGRWPQIRIGHRGPADTRALTDMLLELVSKAGQSTPLAAHHGSEGAASAG